MWRHRSVSLNNEKICCEIIEDKIAFCEKTAGLRRGKFSDSNSACLKVLVPVKIFQFQDMLNESERYQDAANGLLAVKHDLIVHQMDVKTEYLHAPITQELYIDQPQGFELEVSDIGERLVYRLKKSLYGLKHIVTRAFSK